MTPAALHPGPGPAHDWLRHELDGAEYRPSLVERFWHAVQDLFDRVRDATVAGMQIARVGESTFSITRLKWSLTPVSSSAWRWAISASNLEKRSGLSPPSPSRRRA